jgi:hypothetical protein
MSVRTLVFGVVAVVTDLHVWRPAPARLNVAQPSDMSAAAGALAVAAESLFVAAARPRPAGGVLLAADSATARALGAPARRAGLTVRVAPGRVYCGTGGGRERKGDEARTVGAAVSLSFDTLSADRAVVRWAVTCLLTSPTHAAPFPAGSLGALEVVRQGGAWRVSRTLYELTS